MCEYCESFSKRFRVCSPFILVKVGRTSDASVWYHMAFVAPTREVLTVHNRLRRKGGIAKQLSDAIIEGCWSLWEGAGGKHHEEDRDQVAALADQVIATWLGKVAFMLWLDEPHGPYFSREQFAEHVREWTHLNREKFRA